jgi:hypothetical protein
MSGLSLAAIGVLCLIVFAVFLHLTIFATIRAILAFAGVCLIGAVGFIGRMLGDVATWAAHLGGTATGWAFGVAVPAAVFIALAIYLIHDLHPKHAATKRTGWIAIAVAAMLVAGVSGVKAADGIPNAVRTGVTNARTITSNPGR